MISLTLVLAEVQLMTSSSRPEVDLWSSFCCNSSCCCLTMKLISNKIKLSVFPNCTAVPEIYRIEEVSLRLDMGLREPLTSAGVDESRQWPG